MNSFKKSSRMLLHRFSLELAIFSFFLFLFNYEASELFFAFDTLKSSA